MKLLKPLASDNIICGENMDRFQTLCCGLLVLSTVLNATQQVFDAKTFMGRLQEDSMHTALEIFWRDMAADNTFRDYMSHNQQFIAAARASVQINNQNITSLSMQGQMFFWTNSNLNDFQDDCDTECWQKLTSLTTTGTSTPLTPETTIHTELKMLYGKTGREGLMEPAVENTHIVVMYTRSVPCSQLRCKTDGKAYYAECAGDLKNYRHDKQGRPIMLTVYSDVFRDCRNRRFDHIGEEQTNERVSNLYLKIGGIPSYKVANNLRDLVLQNSGFQRYFDSPSPQIFPRLTYTRGYDQRRRFLKCIVEDDQILSEIMDARFIKQQMDFLQINATVYKEVVYRIMNWIFIFKSGEGETVQTYSRFLTEVFLKLYVHLNRDTHNKQYKECEYFGSYFEREDNRIFRENSLTSEDFYCRAIIYYDKSLFKEELCDINDPDVKYHCAELICYWIYEE